MPEHHTKRTKECEAFCPKCGQKTMHRVDDGRQGPCIDPDHDNPLRTIPGLQQFRVIYLDLGPRLQDKARRRQKDFEDFGEALAFFQRYGRELATLWKTSCSLTQRLR